MVSVFFESASAGEASAAGAVFAGELPVAPALGDLASASLVPVAPVTSSLSLVESPDSFAPLLSFDLSLLLSPELGHDELLLMKDMRDMKGGAH